MPQTRGLDTNLRYNKVNLELCQRLGNVIKAKANKEEEDSEWIEEEEWLNEPPKRRGSQPAQRVAGE